MKALLLTPDFPPMLGGIATVLEHWARELGPELVTMAPEEPGWQEWDRSSGLTVLRFPYDRRSSAVKKAAQQLALSRRVGQIALREQVDVSIGGMLCPMVWSLARLKRRLGVPYIVATYSEDIAPPWAGGFKDQRVLALLRSADRVIANSSHTRGLLLDAGVKLGKVAQIHHAVDPEEFAEDAGAVRELRSRRGLAGKRLLLTVCRLEARKGIDTVLRALPRILDEFPDVVYAIVGSGEDEDRLRTIIRECAIGDHVILVGRAGPRPALAAWYHACELFVMASRPAGPAVEGFGVVFLEAATCGKPAVAGRAGGTGDAVIDGKTGLRVDPTSTDAVAGAILRLLRDRELGRKLGEAGRRRVAEEFNWKHRAGQLRELLLDVACSPQAPAGTARPAHGGG